MDIKYVIKNIWQCFLVLVEFAGIATLFVLITSQIVPCKDFIDYIQRGTLGLAIYEFVVFISLNYIVDAEKDSANAIITSYKHAIIACETNNEEIKKKVSDMIIKQTDESMMNSSKTVNEYRSLEKLMNENRISELKYNLALKENMFEACDLKWKYSLLLRKFK